MSEHRRIQYKMRIMQAGPIPPSGGPLRERYLDHHGREELKTAASVFTEAIALLGAHAVSMPAMDFTLVESDDDVRGAIQREKRARWTELRTKMEQPTLDAVEPHIKKSVKAAMDALNYLEDH